MGIITLLFYAFAFMVLFSAVMVVSVRNPVHSVLFLIFTFFNAAGLLVLISAEYLAMTLVIVYVGAVAVLFLFVVMMMDVDFATWRQGFIKKMPLGITVAVALFSQLCLIFYASSINNAGLPLGSKAMSVNLTVTNAEAIGMVLYTEYAYIFILAGLVLLVAMIGAVILTLRHSEIAKKQTISKQLMRKRDEAVALVQVEIGKGVEI